MDKLFANRELGTSIRPLSDYEMTVRQLSDRLVEAQRPIRILDAIKWDNAIERSFFAAGCRKLPLVTPAFYQDRPLAFDPEAKIREFQSLERCIHRRLGVCDGPGRIMTRMCREYRAAVRMLVARGTKRFAEISRQLYGSTKDLDCPETLQIAGPRLRLYAPSADQAELRMDASQAVDALTVRLRAYFQSAEGVRVRLSDGIVADAAAGSSSIRIRKNATFTDQDVRLLEVHEGWVHLGTTLNGQSQPVCTFLSKGPPSSTLTQEGLAVLTEVAAGATFPERIRRLNHRVDGLTLAESGADFLEVYRFFEEQGYEPRDSYQQTMRLFRGSLPAGCGPFTKDLCYVKGYALLTTYLRSQDRRDAFRHFPLLFCGKTALGDLDTLDQLVEEGLVAPPRFVPPQFQTEEAMTPWLAKPKSIRGRHAGRFDMRSIQPSSPSPPALYISATK